MGVEACYAELVGSIVDGGRIGVHRGFGREFYRAGRGFGKSVVAFSDGRSGECGAHDVCSGRETVCGDCGGVVVVCVWIAVSWSAQDGGVKPPLRKSEAVFGDDLFGVFVDQSESGVLGGELKP